VAGLFEERVSCGVFSLSVGPDGMLRKSLSERVIRSIHRKVFYHSRIKNWSITKSRLSDSVVCKLNPSVILVEKN
jgi:hypothetical protein